MPPFAAANAVPARDRENGHAVPRRISRDRRGLAGLRDGGRRRRADSGTGRGHARQRDGEDANRLGNVFQGLFAEIDDLDRDVSRGIGMHFLREADAAGRGDAFQPRGDVDAVAKQVVALNEHVADGDADAQQHVLLGPEGEVARPRRLLDLDGAANRIDRAGKFGEHGIAGHVEDAPVEGADQLGHRLLELGEARDRGLLVEGDEAAVTGDIRCQDDGQLAAHAWRTSSKPSLWPKRGRRARA